MTLIAIPNGVNNVKIISSFVINCILRPMIQNAANPAAHKMSLKLPFWQADIFDAIKFIIVVICTVYR